MSNLEKPTKVEVGQRWKFDACGCEVTILEGQYFAHPPTTRVVCPLDGDSHVCFPKSCLAQCTYLGPPSTVMEANAKRLPARCLRCGGDKNGRGYMDEACWERNACESFRWAGEWDRGARDFPRSPTAAPRPVEAAKEKWREARGLDASLKPARPAIPASCQLERWDATGPLTALQAIQARKKPEPWIPECDELFWIPDAGT